MADDNRCQNMMNPSGTTLDTLSPLSARAASPTEGLLARLEICWMCRGAEGGPVCRDKGFMYPALNIISGCLTASPGLKPHVSCLTPANLDIHLESGHSYTHITAMPAGSQSSQSQTQYSPQSSPSKSQQPIVHAGGRNAQGQIVCKHDLPAKELTVVKDTPNKGKVRCFAISGFQDTPN